ncbi:MAG: molybdopterin dinucleotide binding domain-containing protein, partial [Pseudomonadota bacterium]
YTKVSQVQAAIAEADPFAGNARGEAAAVPAPGEGIEVLFERPIYAGDGLVRRSEHLQQTTHGGTPAASMSSAVAEQLGVADGDSVTIEGAGQSLTIAVAIDDRIGPETVRVPLGYVAADVSAGATVRKA